MINTPNINFEDVIDAIKKYYSSNQLDNQMIEKLNNLDVNKYIQEEKDYKTKGENGELVIDPSKQEKYFTKDQMTVFYELLRKIHMPKDDTTKDDTTIYDYLMQKDQDILCPYCNMESPCELDHFLPKSKFYSYSITPINLIPICSTCNNNQHKFIHYPHYIDNSKTNSVIDYIFHPYFDDMNEWQWLHATVTFTKLGLVDGPFFMLSVEKPSTWEDCKYKRIQAHYKILKFQERLIPKMKVKFGYYRDAIINWGKTGEQNLKSWLTERCNEIHSSTVDATKLMFQALLNNFYELISYVDSK